MVPFAYLLCLLLGSQLVLGLESVEGGGWASEDYGGSEELDDERVYKNPRNSPSAECPRDESHAEFMGQKCLRKCSNDEDCKSKKKKCLCDGLCGMSCIKPERECEEVSSPALGSVSVTGRLFGDRAVYSCESGYHVVGLKERVCRGDGNWSGSPPTCKHNVYCKEPPRHEHARHNALPEQTTFPLDTTLHYQCHTGYVTKGFTETKCLAIDNTASWFGPDFTCEPRSCGAPAETGNGWHAGDCYTFGCRVLYHCSEGYELVGKADRSCQADGSWFPRDLPSCVLVTAVECPTPESPPQGKAVYTSCAYNSVVSYECRYGYTLVGEPTRRCGADRRWSGATPKCQEIDCGPPAALHNGWIENLESGTGLGASVIFRCRETMLLLGNASSVCQLDGTWRYQTPLCLAPCVIPAVAQGNVTVETNGSFTDHVLVQHGTELSVQCEERYEPSGIDTPVACNNGTWSHIPRCQPARCKYMAKAPKNGMVIAPKTEHGMKARYTCRDGYTLRGENTTECRYGNWSGELPYCQEVYCPFPGYVENGKVLLVGNMGLYDYRPYVRKVTNNKQIMYDCNRGFVLAEGPPGATCVGGHWSPKQLPRCVPGMHPRLRWSRSVRARRELRANSLYRLRRTREGLSVGSLSVLCHGQTRCFTDPCPHPGSLNNGLVLFSEDGLKVVFHCRRGYVLEGSPEATCVSGNWTPLQPPRCLPGGGWSLLQSLRRRKRALAGTNTVIRKPATTGSNKPPDGDRTDRKGINRNDGRGEGVGGTGEEEEDGEGTEGTESPREGQTNNPRTNKPRKKLKGKGGPCEVVVVEPYMKLEAVKRGRESNATYGHGTVVRLSCAQGYTGNLPNSTARCVRGKWKPSKPHCGVSPCFVPPSENGIYTSPGSSAAVAGTVLSPDVPVGNSETVEFSCSPGYNVQGTASMDCLYGQWSIPVLPSCTPAPCQLPVIKDGQYLLGYRPGLTIGNGSSIRFQCDTEFKAIPSTPVQCILGELRPKTPQCKKDPGIMYVPGRDITEVGAMGAIDYMVGLRGSCGPPARVQGSLAFRNGEPLAEAQRNFPDGTEVTFNCIASLMGEKITWRIICEDGNWVGRSLNCEVSESRGGDGGISGGQTSPGGSSQGKDNTTCVFRNSESNVATFYRDQPVTEDIVEFPSGALLMFRCLDIGKFAMIGSSRRRCQNGEWDGQRPVCFGLNQDNDYALEKPPTILFRHQLGPIAQSNDGKLVVYPATVLHMECLWIRRFGTPKWVVSHNYRKYPEAWSSDPGRDSQLEYRLSILHATKDDSGTFSCITPTRHTHSVEIEVKAVHCSPLPTRRGLKLSTQETKMNTRVLLSCANGNSLIGAHEILCLPSGNWSAPIPVCESMECPDLGNLSDVNLRASILSREVGGQAVFSCSPGYGLGGPAHSTCLPSGEWATPLPTCREVQCPSPGAPENGFVQGSAVYKAGDIVQFSCNPDYMLEGQPIIACQENGRWSGALPKCVKACSYPGTVISGRMSSVKFYYHIGETVSFSCDPGLKMQGASMLRCLRTGKWSNTIPTCLPPTPEP